MRLHAGMVGCVGGSKTAIVSGSGDGLSFPIGGQCPPYGEVTQLSIPNAHRRLPMQVGDCQCKPTTVGAAFQWRWGHRPIAISGGNH